MPVPTSISELSTTPGSNSPSGSDAPSVLDDHQRTAYAFIRTLSDEKAAIANAVLLTGNQTVAGVKTFSSNIVGNLTGNASGTALNVTGTVAIANGGTGQITALAAFNALKQAASDTYAGTQENATAAETQTGSATDRTVTPAGFAASSLGYGQTWQTVTRTSGVTYTNSTGRPIQFVAIGNGSGAAQFNMTIDGYAFPQVVQSSGGVLSVLASYVIPPGKTYVYTIAVASATIAELR